MRFVPYSMVLLMAGVASGLGGYSPWATLLLELGAVALLASVLLDVLWGTPREERASNLERRKAWKGLPFWVRHSGLSRFARTVTLGRVPGRAIRTDVEILPPEASGIEARPRVTPSYRDEDALFLRGYAFRRTGLGIPLALLTLWIGLSLVPLSGGRLRSLSPQAHALRTEAQSLMGAPPEEDAAPWSLAPLFALRDLWLWLAYLALFYAAVHLARRPRRVERLTWLLMMAGIAAGVYGIGQWLLGLRELFGTDPSTSGLRATGPFGNRNHYALFMEMLLLCGLGWLGARWVGLVGTAGARRHGPADRRPRRGPRRGRQEAGARLFLVGLGLVMASVGLIFSLSRSGITFALVASAAFVLLAGGRAQPWETGTIDVETKEASRLPSRRRRPSGRFFWAFALGVVGVAFWIGLDPVVTRFELLPGQWEAEQGRGQVWADSLGAVGGFWLTGSGLGSFRHVFPIYRSFGGRIFYSWAHNDYLQLLVELGVPGLLLLLWMMAAVVRRARQVRRRLEDHPPLLYLHAGYCAAVFAVALHSFTDFGLHMPANGALLSVIVGVVVGLSVPEERPPAPADESQTSAGEP